MYNPKSYTFIILHTTSIYIAISLVCMKIIILRGGTKLHILKLLATAAVLVSDYLSEKMSLLSNLVLGEEKWQGIKPRLLG